MLPLKIAAPMAALVLLTGACGIIRPGDSEPSASPSRRPTPSGSPTPAVSPSGGPVLERVWQDPYDFPSVGYLGNTARGNILLAQGGDKREILFIDGTTGRVTGRSSFDGSAEAGDPTAVAATDARGRPALAVQGHKLSVYDANGRLLGRAPTTYTLYAGGYYIQNKHKAGLVLRTLSGHQVARLPLPPHPGPWAPPDITLQAVRPGLLLASNYGTGRSQVALIDVSKPGKARVHPLSPPPEADSVQVGVDTAVADGHVYVKWLAGGDDERAAVARYNAPATRPAWHVRLPSEINAFGEINAYPGAKDTITISDKGGDDFRFLRPDTGSLVVPKAGADVPDSDHSDIIGVAGGRAYATAGDDIDNPKTNVIDPRTGAVVRTIYAKIDGVTSSGDLIEDIPALSAYRWKN